MVIATNIIGIMMLIVIMLVINIDIEVDEAVYIFIFFCNLLKVVKRFSHINISTIYDQMLIIIDD